MRETPPEQLPLPLGPRKYASLHERLIANTAEPENAQACWTWTAKRDRWGYGRFNAREGGKVVVKMAHIEMMRTLGVEAPRGHHHDHLCRNPSCINPDHLEVVTAAENMRRRSGFSQHPAL